MSVINAGALNDLEAKGRKLVKADGRQIALFLHDGTVYACNNRCPHEGYPLIEGSVGTYAANDSDTPACALTCNWHNWKFDLATGANLLDGERVRTYPVQIIDGEIRIEIVDPPASERRAAAMASLRQAFDRNDYTRMAREMARLEAAGGPEADTALDAVRAAVDWSHDRFEYGATHAVAVAADWLDMRAGMSADDPLRMAPALEAIGYLSWDTLRQPAYPYPTDRADFAPDLLVAAIENEDEAAAVAQVRSALAAGLTYADIRPALARAALAHYCDFGHAAIYVLKVGQAVDHLGPDSAEPLTLALVRMLINASREDLIPEFRHYATALANWDGTGTDVPAMTDLVGAGIKQALDMTAAGSGDPAALFDVLVHAAAWQMVHFDLDRQSAVDQPVSRNVTWLDFTHALTFANAVRHLASEDAALWAPGLLQIACFVGRNAPFVDANYDASAWRVGDAGAFIARHAERMLDHGQFDYLAAAHHMKLLWAVRDELAATPDAPWAAEVLAAVNRFYNSPLKRKHVLRSVNQARQFVAAEG